MTQAAGAKASIGSDGALIGIPLADRAASRSGDVSSLYRAYIVAAIWLVLLFRFVDLQIIGVLLEPIRAEFKVSDTALGLLGGTAFALFYGALGIPVAWLADRYSRRNIIAACLAIWSGMTALCGTASSFTGLFMSRVGVGFGEAGGTPPSYSLVSDYFPASKRSTIFAILNTSVPIGVFTGFILGGFISARYGWRATLIIVGLAGVLVAIVVRLTVREPKRGASDAQIATGEVPSTADTMRYLWKLHSYRHLVVASSIFTLGAAGSGTWIASFFIRTHEMPAVQVSTWLACIYGGGGLLGALLGGFLADGLSRRHANVRWQAWLPAITTAATMPFLFFVYLWPDPITALLVHLGTTLLMHSWLGPAYATVQSLAGAKRRAMAAAVHLLVVNVIALGFGPLLVGIMSDAFRSMLGNASLRYSILTLTVVSYAWASVHFLLASRTLREDLQTAAGAARA